ncbi:UPF0182 family protein [Moorena sp. SIO2C4]|uniref:UPF0182 family protein n=1 Tax=Moorena sp. SIO2C4 TaxID=2607824 RepID=UPI0013CBF400|nr:UPF0182 family protein [Moorena sp. SIO2C4]NES40584.1 UPF0182 family protein [Moorena sp. SIO2C4]
MTKLLRWVTGLLGVWIAWNLLSHLVAAILWFTEVDYLSAFLLRLQTQLSLWVIVFIISLGFLLTNLWLANHFKHPENLADLEITWLKGFKTLDSSSLTLNQTRLNSPSPIVRSGVRPRGKFSKKRPAFRLRSLLPFALALSLLVGVVLLYYGKMAFSVWHFHRETLSATFMSEATPPLPSPLGWVSLGKLFLSESRSNLVWQLGMISAVMVGLMVNAQLWLRAIALALSFAWAMVISEQWGRILEYLYPTHFNTTEPLFGQDIGFYVFGVPVWQLLNFWLGGLFLFGLVAVWLIYLTSGNSLSDGKFPGFSQNQLRHLYGLGSAVSAITAFHYWLSRYNLLYSTRGVAYGAGYTNVSVKLPFNTGLSILAFAIALLLLLRAIFWIRRLPTKIPVALWILGLYLGIWGIAGIILPAAVQRFKVEPNELALERPYIARTIALTRAAFDLDSIEAETFNPQGKLTSTDLEKNHLTIDNIPLWDTRPLLQSNRQLQQLRLYYQFTDANFDRYTIKVKPDQFKAGLNNVGRLNVSKLNVGRLNLDWLNLARLNVARLNVASLNLDWLNLARLNVARLNVASLNLDWLNLKSSNNTIKPANLGQKAALREQANNLGQKATLREQPNNLKANNLKANNLKLNTKTQKQQVLVAARELDYDAVPKQAQTWVNKHLVYTHGYGFTLSAVNQVGEGGLPYYFIKDIGSGGGEALKGSLYTSSPEIRDSIPIGQPRIYYGELTNNYIMTSTKTQELDYPSGEENVYNTYDGTGGVALNSFWRRLVFAQYLKDWQMVLTGNFTPETRLLFRRNIRQRIQAIAPFLRYDADPYLVIADTSEGESAVNDNYLYWMVDGYTTSDRYPYADPGNNQFNYIRNSVKVVIDAYNGDVSFYIADPKDPIIQTWSKIFPNFFKSLDQMPSNLRTHLRYPIDLFNIQSERLLAYHMTDPQVFYNQEDLWRIPQEIYAGKSKSVEPYYIIMKLPKEKSEEFILLHPYTPTGRNNLIGWLAGRSDGDHYGKLLLYQFPKQQLIYGPEQIEALINQDPVISQQISLWNQKGSRAVQGNLLVIPIEQSLLYVEPLYIEAEQHSLPTLVRVIVVYQNQIIMAQNLKEALDAIFKPEQSKTPTIVRPVEETALP